MDFAIEWDKIIEVFGDYWHANPAIYTDDKLNKHQVSQRKKDRSRLAYLQKCGKIVLVVWEKDIKEDPASVRRQIVSFSEKS